MTFYQAAENFGLAVSPTWRLPNELNGTYEIMETGWQLVAGDLRNSNQASGSHITYKLLYIGRHGEGNHNVAQEIYGIPAWDVCSVLAIA